MNETFGRFTISDDPSKLNIDTICGFLARSYWANERPRNKIEKSIRHSLNFGVYDGDKQIGFSRVVTDHAVFAYLCDVFIDEEYRGQSLGKWMMNCILSHPDLIDIRRFVLVTGDAHELYRQFGFTELTKPELYMEKFDPSRF